MCAGRYLLKLLLCLCAVTKLLSRWIAYVHQHNYWIAFLLICRPLIIDLCFCLCVLLFVSRPFLLVCKGEIIEKFLCFCAIRVLLSSSIAYVQKDAYWHYLLLVWKRIIEFFPLLVCSGQLIDSLDCLCARIEYLFCSCAATCLLRECFAWVHVSYYWHLKLFMCIYVIIESSCCLSAIWR